MNMYILNDIEYYKDIITSDDTVYLSIISIKINGTFKFDMRMFNN